MPPLSNAKLEEFWQVARFEFEMGMEGINLPYQAITTELPSSTKKNVYPWLSNIPGFREWVGDRVVHRLAARTYELENKSFEHTFAVDKNDLEDDEIGVYAPAFRLQGQHAKEFVGLQIAAKLASGITDTCWDGQFFFDTDHPVDIDNSALGVQSNKLVHASNYDIRVAGNEVAAFQLARAAMRTWKREDGQRAGYIGNLIVVGPELEAAAMTIRQAFIPKVVGSGAAAIPNPLLSAAPEVLVIDQFDSSAGVWHLACTTKPIKPMLWQNRKDVEFTILNQPTDEAVYRRREIEFGADLRGAPGYTFPGLMFRMSQA